MTVEEARAAFPVFERLAYLNAGTFGPLARATLDAINEQGRLELEGGRGGAAYFEGLQALREGARTKVAAQIGVDPASVALTGSTTDGCNIVVAGLELGPGDEIVTTDVEHFGLLGALGTSGARVRVASIGGLPPEAAFDAIRAEVGPKTRLLALSHVAWTTGNLLPVEELRGEDGTPILVDGAQSVGAIPVDAGRFDFYTVSGQKWLCGPDSTGALYVADPERVRVAFPSYFSQDGYEPDGSFTPREGAVRFEPGWVSTASLAGLAAALDGAPDWRFSRAAELAARCRERLAERFDVVTAPNQSTLVTFRVEGDATAEARRLFDEGVVVRDLPGTSWLRASCGYWTSDEDIDRLLAALD